MLLATTRLIVGRRTRSWTSPVIKATVLRMGATRQHVMLKATGTPSHQNACVSIIFIVHRIYQLWQKKSILTVLWVNLLSPHTLYVYCSTEQQFPDESVIHFFFFPFLSLQPSLAAFHFLSVQTCYQTPRMSMLGLQYTSTVFQAFRWLAALSLSVRTMEHGALPCLRVHRLKVSCIS